ncbi:hypothetical protein PanWU01x14_167020 [Parasponia andersonii]|uniref:Uncharacterized protein n=1 Tax=Parasponia andersonii TaxID=3476 RepID=A0A2P5CB67_PARAD|nr:hypothetical protein PanWU01x14_167020 [Parasponia andersonii]
MGEAYAKFIYALCTNKPVDLVKWMFDAIVASGQGEATTCILSYPYFIQALINSYSPDEFMNEAHMNLPTQLTMKTFQSQYASVRSITIATTRPVSEEIKSLLQTMITHLQIPCNTYPTIVPDDTIALTSTPGTTQGEPAEPDPTAPKAPPEATW